MKEADYIVATDIVRVRTMKRILRDLSGVQGPHIAQEEVASVELLMRLWEERMEHYLDDSEENDEE